MVWRGTSSPVFELETRREEVHNTHAFHNGVGAEVLAEDHRDGPGSTARRPKFGHPKSSVDDRARLGRPPVRSGLSGPQLSRLEEGFEASHSDKEFRQYLSAEYSDLTLHQAINHLQRLPLLLRLGTVVDVNKDIGIHKDPITGHIDPLVSRSAPRRRVFAASKRE